MNLSLLLFTLTLSLLAQDDVDPILKMQNEMIGIIEERPTVSTTVSSAIKRETERINQKISPKIIKKIKEDKKVTSKKSQSDILQLPKLIDFKNLTLKKSNSDYEVKLINITNNEEVKNFELRYGPRLDKISFSEKGISNIESDFDAGSEVYTNIASKDFITIATMITLNNNEKRYQAYTLKNEDYYNIMGTKLENENFGVALIKLPENYSNIDVLTVKDYMEVNKVLIDGNGNKTTENQKAKYIFLKNLNRGINFIEIEFKNGETFAFLAYCYLGKISFLNLENAGGLNYKKVSLFEQGLMSKTPSPFSLTLKKIVPLNSNKEIQKTKLNEYLVPIQDELLVKNYLVLNHLKNVIHANITNVDKVFVPTIDYIQEMLYRFGIEGLKNKCIVEISIESKSPILESISDGEGILGNSSIDVMYLSSEGEFSKTPMSTMQKIFIVLAEESRVDTEVTSYSGRKKIVTSHCVNSSYTLEQISF